MPGRASIVLTRDKSWSAEGAISVGSIEAAIAAGKRWLAEQGTGENRLILFGGGEIYKLGLPLCQEIELTRVAASPEAEAKFPEFNIDEWQSEDFETFGASETAPAFSYHRLTRRGSPVIV